MYVKSLGVPKPCEAQNLLMPRPRDCQGGQMPYSSPEGEGGGGAGHSRNLKEL